MIRYAPSLQTATRLESVRLVREINSSNVHDRLVLTLRVITQESQSRDQSGRSDIKGEFILVDGELLDVFRETSEEVLTVFVHWRVDVL